MMSGAGQVTVDLSGAVAVHSTRPAAIGRVFAGKKPDDVARLLPMLFAVCGEAQAMAGHLAMGLDLSPTAPMIVAAEALREHLMRMAQGWGAATGTGIGVAELRRIHGLVKLARQSPEEALQEARALVQLLAAPEGELREGFSWVAQASSIAGHLLRMVIERGWAGLAIAGQDGETSTLTLMQREPLMQAVLASHGAGLYARLAARIVHVLHLLDVLAGKTRLAVSTGAGTATVETSRGFLTHAVVMQDGVVTDYHVTAPTDCNFSSHGPASASLAALKDSCTSGLEPAARLLVECFDPCVAYSLKVQ